MVAVAHGVEHGSVVNVDDQAPQRGDHLFHQGVILHMPAPYPPAAEHQLGVVESRQVAVEEGLDDSALRIVDEDHDVRDFQGRVAADLDARCQARYHRSLGGADQGAGAVIVAVLLEVESDEQAVARGDVRCLPVDEDESRRQLLQDAPRRVVGHGGANPGDALRAVVGFEVGLGKDELYRRRRRTYAAHDIPPVAGIGSVLVAGDDGPGVDRDVAAGQ